MNKLFDITGNVTVITGGTGVLGRAIAKYLALEGAKVIILGRKEDVGNAIAADITAAGGSLAKGSESMRSLLDTSSQNRTVRFSPILTEPTLSEVRM